MQYVHEPVESITYIIRGKYAAMLNDILTEEHNRWQWIGQMMAHAFDGTYYLDEYGGHSELLDSFSLRDNGDLEINLYYYEMGNALSKFLLWKFPDIEIKMYDVRRSDAWWWSCQETTVITNDPEGAEAMGLTPERYYMDLGAKLEEADPENVKCQDGVYLLREKCDEEGDARWTPLTECFKFEFKVIELSRPTTSPVIINLDDIEEAKKMSTSNVDDDLPF